MSFPLRSELTTTQELDVAMLVSHFKRGGFSGSPVLVDGGCTVSVLRYKSGLVTEHTEGMYGSAFASGHTANGNVVCVAVGTAASSARAQCLRVGFFGPSPFLWMRCRLIEPDTAIFIVTFINIPSDLYSVKSNKPYYWSHMVCFHIYWMGCHGNTHKKSRLVAAKPQGLL